MSSKEMVHHSAAVCGRQTEYVVLGEGEPVLFIHGAGIIGGWEFARHWANDYTVICPYQMGWGETESPSLDATVDDYVRQNIALMHQLGYERFHLIGFSMGGWIASTLAAKHPDLVKKLVLIAPAGYWHPEHPTADFFNIPPSEVLEYLAADPQVLLRYLPPPSDPLMQQVQQYRSDSAFAQLAWDLLGAGTHMDLVAQVRAPSLLVWGQADRVIPFSQAAVWQQTLDDVRLYAIADVGHYPFLEHPETSNVIHDFLGRKK